MSKVYSIPEGSRVYAIGDIHGYAEVLDRMHAQIDADLQASPAEDIHIVYIGDYVDRGPDSAGVIERLIARKTEHPDITHVFLKGNHENGMLSFMEDPTGKRQDWLQWGGLQTLVSYGVHIDTTKPFTGQLEAMADGLRASVSDAHLDFLNNLTLLYELGDYVFAHAGIRPGVPLDQQTQEDLTFIRKGFLDHDKPLEKRVVHGHTICPEPEILPNRINIETGLYTGGKLTCAVLEADQVRILQVTQGS